ncbi:DUF6893 family small protein [Dictyobacter kobayashii]|uniref:Uncharacterized protein n=1 Tax=Dictyobacter kobayashii TaxID=2014872 RepID=A0A402AYW4_9CHLR|nr:hypothetical protein KDK_81010 [Dictyobacter kobayashii]
MITIRINLSYLMLALAGLGLLIVGIQLPDIQRYLRMRDM